MHYTPLSYHDGSGDSGPRPKRQASSSRIRRTLHGDKEPHCCQLLMQRRSLKLRLWEAAQPAEGDWDTLRRPGPKEQREAPPHAGQAPCSRLRLPQE